MSNENRYRNGTQLVVKVPVASATVIEIGDFVCEVDGKLLNIQTLQAAGTLSEVSAAAAQSSIADAFIGIALHASASGETQKVNVDISIQSIYEYPLNSAGSLSFGNLIEVLALSSASNSWGGRDQLISAGTTNPIAVCVEQSLTGTGKLIKLLPSVKMNSVAGHS